MGRRSLRRRAGILVSAAALAAGCGTTPVAPTDAAGPEQPAWHVPDGDDLRPYGDCVELQRDLARREAQKIPSSLDGDLPQPSYQAVSSGPIDVGVRVPTRANVTENGVDEPSPWASDGQLLLHPDGTKLRVYDVSGPSPVARGVLNVGDAGMSAGQVLLAGSRALLIGGEKPNPRVFHGRSGPADLDTPHPALTVPDPTWLALVDLADPDRPRLLSVERTQGRLVTARLTGATARVVTSHPGPLSAPLWREVWDSEGTAVEPDPTPDCADVRHTPGRSRAGMLLVETVNLGRDDALARAETTGIVGATLAYNSPARLYVTTPAARTGDPVGVHAFDAGPAPETTYTGSGSVDGHLRSAGAVSERAGHLRLLVNDRPAGWRTVHRTDEEEPDPGTARIVVLDAASGLATVGRSAPDLPGEYLGIRWVDDLVLLTRTGGPTRVVDLTDPQKPRLAGVLSGAGFPYVHPLGGHRLLRAGQSPDRGLEVATLDVRRPGSPEPAATLDLGRGSTSAGRGQHAFSYDPERRVALLIGSFDTGDLCPPGQYCLSGGDQVPQNCRPVSSCSGFSGPAEIPTLLAIRVGTDGRLSEAGRWTGGEVHTVVPLGNRVAIVDYGRITLADPDSLEPTGSLVIDQRALEPSTDDFYPLPKGKKK